MKSDAVISECGLYRYSLTRTWDDSLRPAAFVMLNPSTADAMQDDPTIRRCVGFARAWGCGGIEVVNLFAFRATNPKELLRTGAPIGPDNDRHVRRAAERCHPVVAAWGAHPFTSRRRDHVLAILLASGGAVLCLGRTANGCPRHPLYVKADVTPAVYLPALLKGGAS